jgi:MFS family permease
MGSLAPVIPRFMRDELGGSDLVIGLAVGAFAVTSLLARPSLGRLGDQRGARLLIVIGCLVGMLGMLSLLLVTSPNGAIVSRLPQGFAQAALMTGSTTLAMDIAPPERRGEAASYILVAFHLGLALGPLVGEWADKRWSFGTVWVIAAGCMLAGAAVASRLPHRPRTSSGPPTKMLYGPSVMPGVIIALAMMGSISIGSFVALYAKEIGVARVAPVFLLTSLTIALVRIGGGRLPDRLGPIRSTSWACAVAVLGSLALVGFHNRLGLFLGVSLVSGGAALLMPSLVPVVVHNVPENRRGSAMATFSMFLDISVALTGPVFGLIAGATSYRGMFLAGAVTTVLGLIGVRTYLVARVRSWDVTPVA